MTADRARQSAYQLVHLDNGWTIGQFAPLAELAIPHLVTTRVGLDVSAVGADRPAAAQKVAAVLGASGAALADQVHGGRVIPVGGPGLAGQADGLATSTPGVALVAFSADCPLVLLADRLGGAVGIAHASWRSTVQRIVPAVLDVLAGRFGVQPGNLVACISPSAGPCCYEVGMDVFDRATVGLGPSGRESFISRAGKMYLDLWHANREQLIRGGLSPANIHVSGVCTICHHDQYPSYRAEGDQAGRFMAAIALAAR